MIPNLKPDDRPLEGIVWMVLTGLSFVAVTGVVKHGAADLPAAQSAFMRYLLGLVFVLPFLSQMRETLDEPALLKKIAARSLIHSVAVMLWFYSMTQIPLAEVTALNYLNPIFITLGAFLFLGEGLSRYRIAALFCGFIGALIILRPGFREVELGHIAMLVTAFAFGIGHLIAKSLSRDMAAGLVVAWLSLGVAIGLAPFALAVWQTPTLQEWGWMGLVAVFATFGHYAMTRAFAAAPVTVTQPATFLQLIWASLLGWIAFGESVDIWVFIGGGIIFTAVLITAWRDSLKRKI